MKEFSLNRHGQLTTFCKPLVMGILNVTPDSFYSDSRFITAEEVGNRIREMVAQGADIIDVGACSTRPGSSAPSQEEELARLERVLDAVVANAGESLISIDTFRPAVARLCCKRWNVDIINDASGGCEEMFSTVAEMKVAYVLMHTRGDSVTMQSLVDYRDVTAEVLSELAFKLDALRRKGVADVFVDPGFGFAKTIEQNYELLRNLSDFAMLDCPVLVGVSRKSMISKVLNCTARESLTGTVALNTAALLNGASVLRVHDVKAAADVRTLIGCLDGVGEGISGRQHL